MERGRDELGKRRPRRQHRNLNSAEAYAARRKAENAKRPRQFCVILGPGDCYWTRDLRSVLDDQT